MQNFPNIHEAITMAKNKHADNRSALKGKASWDAHDMEAEAATIDLAVWELGRANEMEQMLTAILGRLDIEANEGGSSILSALREDIRTLLDPH